MAHYIQSDIYIGLHWLTLSVTGLPVEVLREVVETLTDQKTQLVGGSRFFAARYETVDGGATILSGHKGDGDASLCTINLSGRACESLIWGDFRYLVRYISANGGEWKVTRIDYAIDGAPFTPAEFKRSCELGGIRARAHKLGFHETRQTVGGEKQVNQTCEVGSRISEKFIRVYDQRNIVNDAFAEPIQITRLEIQLRDASADQFFRLYLGDTQKHCGLDAWMVVLTEMLDITWMHFLSWVARVSDIYLSYPVWRVVCQQKRTVEQKIYWLLKSVSKTLAGVSLVYPDIGETLQKNGTRKLSAGERQYYTAAIGAIA